MHEKLLIQIDQWHKEEKHQSIVEAVEAIPEEIRGYQLIGQYAVALNNTARYEKALAVLDTVKEEGITDQAWHYRRGFAYYMLEQDAEAAFCMKQAVNLGRNDEQTLMILADCERTLYGKPQKEAQLKQRFQERKLPDPTVEPFSGFDFTSFWDNCEYAEKEYLSEPFSDELVKELESELGYRLPRSYIWLMRQHNGGVPLKDCHPALPTSWADDHIAISGIMGIGRVKANSLGGSFGSRFWIEEWQYPDIGVAICDCPSAGHDLVFLDYRLCGPEGEPMVVHVDQEFDYEITWLANDFESFVRGLASEDEFYDM